MPDLPLPLTNGYGLLDFGVDYPEGLALYPISLRHTKCLLSASFRFVLTNNTLA